jgi:lia operon protein LiaF
MRRMIGIVLFVIGIIILCIALGLDELLVSPILLIIAGVICWRYHYRRLSIFFFTCGVLALLNVDVWKLIMAILFLYFGYRLLVNRPKKEPYDVFASKANSDIEWGKSPCDNSFIGELHLGDQQYELNDIHVSQGFSSIHIDLSRAIIPEGETSLIINGVVGQVLLYLPYDLDASISASVTVGECEVLGRKQGGLKNKLYAITKGYEESTRKVKLSISFFVAEVHVRYL